MADDRYFDNLPTNWLEANQDRVFRCHEALKDKMWVLRGGYADCWAWGDMPPAVPNRSMPWVRPAVTDMAVRLYAFDDRIDLMIERFSERRTSWRGFPIIGTGLDRLGPTKGGPQDAGPQVNGGAE